MCCFFPLSKVIKFTQANCNFNQEELVFFREGPSTFKKLEYKDKDSV